MRKKKQKKIHSRQRTKMYSKGPLICRNISIQNRQMLLRVFNFIEQKSRILREKKQKKKKSRRVRKERESTEIGQEDWHV